MNDLRLNCESPCAAVRSLAAILGMNTEALVDKLSTFDSGDLDCADEIERKLTEKILEGTAVPSYQVVWFHGTRLPTEHRVSTEGLLPSHMMRNRLRDELKFLSADLTKLRSNPFATSAAFKPESEGPFGFLCRDAAAHPCGSNGAYSDCPELVQDIAGELLGENYNELVQRFNRNRNRCVVHFLGGPDQRALMGALRYAYDTSVEEIDPIEAANSITVCFDGSGVSVPHERIVKVEQLPNPYDVGSQKGGRWEMSA